MRISFRFFLVAKLDPLVAEYLYFSSVPMIAFFKVLFVIEELCVELELLCCLLDILLEFLIRPLLPLGLSSLLSRVPSGR